MKKIKKVAVLCPLFTWFEDWAAIRFAGCSISGKGSGVLRVNRVDGETDFYFINRVANCNGMEFDEMVEVPFGNHENYRLFYPDYPSVKSAAMQSLRSGL